MNSENSKTKEYYKQEKVNEAICIFSAKSSKSGDSGIMYSKEWWQGDNGQQKILYLKMLQFIIEKEII